MGVLSAYVLFDVDDCFEKLTLALWRTRPTLAALARRAGMAIAAERSPFMVMVEIEVEEGRWKLVGRLMKLLTTTDWSGHKLQTLTSVWIQVD